MKTKILVGAVAALLYGGVALAGDNKDCPPGYDTKNTQSNLGSSAAGDESQAMIQTEPVDSSIGGSGQAGMDDQTSVDQGLPEDQSSVDKGLGGSGQEGVTTPSTQQGEMNKPCPPASSTGTGGAGSIEQGVSPSQNVTPQEGAGGSGYQEPLREPEVAPPPPAPVPEPSTGAFTPIEQEKMVTKKEKADMRGVTVTAGGGLEGYTGAFAPEINPGVAYGVQADIKPNKVVGLELGYTGAVNDLSGSVGDLNSGPDLVRNGGQAALTLGLTAAPLQPYLMGGIGIDDYNFRGGGATLAGFRDDTVGNVPVGAGLRTHIGHFTADLRGSYSFLFDQDFAFGVSDMNGNGRYAGTLNIGGTF